MTESIDEATLQMIREKLESLIDDHLDANPEIVEEHGDSFAAVGPPPTVEAVSPDEAAGVSGESGAGGDLSALVAEVDFSALGDNVAEILGAEPVDTDALLEQLDLDALVGASVEKVFDMWSEEDLGLADLFGEE